MITKPLKLSFGKIKQYVFMGMLVGHSTKMVRNFIGFDALLKFNDSLIG